MKTHFINNLGDACVGFAEIMPDHLNELIQKERSYPEIASFHSSKKYEFLASRTLVDQVCQSMDIPYGGIYKDEFGKPYLKSSEYHLSISHSYPFVACIIHKSSPCGIDIEHPRSQLIKIKHKFLNEEELAYCGDDVEKLCQFWSAKEALYKIYGRKKVHFAKELSVIFQDQNTIIGRISINGHNESYNLHISKYNNYYIVYNY